MTRSATVPATILDWLAEEMAKAVEPKESDLPRFMRPLEPGQTIMGRVPVDLRPLLWIFWGLADQIEQFNERFRAEQERLMASMTGQEEPSPEVVGSTMTAVMKAGKSHKIAVMPLQWRYQLLMEIFFYEMRRLFSALVSDENIRVASGYDVVLEKPRRSTPPLLSLLGLQL